MSPPEKGLSRALRLGLALWGIQVLVLAIGASLLMVGDGRWVDPLERVRVVRNFMANPVKMITVEAFGTFCILVGVSGTMDSRDSLLDSVWEGYMPLFIGVCLTLLFVRGLLHPWWLFRREGCQEPNSKNAALAFWRGTKPKGATVPNGAKHE